MPNKFPIVTFFIVFLSLALSDEDDAGGKDDCHHLIPFLLLSKASVYAIPVIWTLLVAGTIVVLVPTCDAYFGQS